MQVATVAIPHSRRRWHTWRAIVAALSKIKRTFRL